MPSRRRSVRFVLVCCNRREGYYVPERAGMTGRRGKCPGSCERGSTRDEGARPLGVARLLLLWINHGAASLALASPRSCPGASICPLRGCRLASYRSDRIDTFSIRLYGAPVQETRSQLPTQTIKTLWLHTFASCAGGLQLLMLSLLLLLMMMMMTSFSRFLPSS